LATVPVKTGNHALEKMVLDGWIPKRLPRLAPMRGSLREVFPLGRGLLRLPFSIIGPPLIRVGENFVGFTRRHEFMGIGAFSDLIRVIAFYGVAVCSFDLG
jgi:hypothetical protein